MAAANELRGLLNNKRTLSALDRHVRRTLDQIGRELAAGVSKPGAARARSLVKRMRELSDRLDPKKKGFVRDWIRENAPRAFVLGDRAATRQLREDLQKTSTEKRADFGEINRTFGGVNNASLKTITAAMETSLGQGADQVRNQLGLIIRRTQQRLVADQEIRDATVGGIIRGATGRQVADDIASSLLGKKVPKQVKERLRARGFRAEDFEAFEQVARKEMISVGGRRMNVRSYSDMVARTQMVEAHKVSTVTRLQQNGVDHVRISFHRQKVKDECTPYAGKVFYVGPLPKDPAGFPKLSDLPNGGPPFHPNCKHVTEPFVVDFEEPEDIEKERVSSKQLPRRLFGKTAKEIRKEVAELTLEQLEEINPEAAESIGEAA